MTLVERTPPVRLLDVRCVMHGPMKFWPALIRPGIVAAVPSLKIRARWGCHGFDGEGCPRQILHETALFALAAGAAPPPGITVTLAAREAPCEW